MGQEWKGKKKGRVPIVVLTTSEVTPSKKGKVCFAHVL